MARGSITKRVGVRGTSYRARVPLGVDAHGRRVVRTATFARKRDAEDWVRRILDEARQGIYVEPSRELLGDYLVRWLDVKRADFRPSTVKRYERVIRKHIAGEGAGGLGQVPLGRLTPLVLQEAYGLIAARSVPTARTVHKVLYQALEQAVRWRLIGQNPSAHLILPKLTPAPRLEWDVEHARVFLAEATSDPYYALFVLALATGLRRGELLALRWPDIDVEQGVVTVDETITEQEHGWGYGPPKSAAGNRRVVVPPAAMSILRRHRAEQLARRLKFGAAWAGGDLVFENGEGGPITPDWPRRRLQRWCVVLGLPKIRFHDLRHTAAALMFAVDAPAQVARERMGHASIETTFDLYGHVSLETQRQLVARLDPLFAGIAEGA